MLPCADIIDKDVDSFPAPLLREWKSQAEAAARQEIGQPTGVSKGRFAIVSQLKRFGAQTNVVVDDYVIPKAIIYEESKSESAPTYFIAGAFVGSFKIKKIERFKRIVLDEIRVIVYNRQAVPEYRPLNGVYPAHTSLYFVEIDAPAKGETRTFTADRYFEETDRQKAIEKRFLPIVLDDKVPHTVYLRMNAKQPGLYQFSIQVLVSIGMRHEVHTIRGPYYIIFERELDWTVDNIEYSAFCPVI